MNIPTVAQVIEMRDRAQRFPPIGSNVVENFETVCYAYLALSDRVVLLERDLARANDDLATTKAALKAKGGRKR
jgi:hypothetical protein